VIERIQASADRSIARYAPLEDQQSGHSERGRLTPFPHRDSEQRR
jgi:hypothetical protein